MWKPVSPLVWQGGCITEDQHPQIYAPQQLVKDEAGERKQGAYVEWIEMGVRLVPAIVEQLRKKRGRYPKGEDLYLVGG